MTALGIAIAALVAFIVSFTYYSIAPARSADAAGGSEPRPAPWQIALELLRSALVAGLISGLMHASGWDGAGQGALLGLSLWSLPVVLLSGSVQWEGVPVGTALVHAGDWIIKLIAIGAIVGLFS